MSKHLAALLPAFLLILQLFNNSIAQSIDVAINVVSITPPIVEVRGKFYSPRTTRNFALVREYAGFSDLADRMSALTLKSLGGSDVEFRGLIPGEYLATAEISTWAYRLRLFPHRVTSAAGHVSWLNETDGLLFLSDLLPDLPLDQRSANVQLSLPQGWSTADGRSSLSVTDFRQTTIFISKRLRVLGFGGPVRIGISGDWKFADTDAIRFAEQIVQEYTKVFGGISAGDITIHILPFPQKAGVGMWEGDTRGNTVTIVSADMAFDTQSVQRLHEQLRHELFHIWVPNGVSLTGKYDWFYEGFAQYQSLKTGVALNRLRFEDYLDTLGRAMTIESMLPSGRSLIEASQARAGVPDLTIYAGGMLAAFLTDIQLLDRSNGKQDVATALRIIYMRHRKSNEPVDGNTAVLNAIDLEAVSRYVRVGERVNWTRALTAVGMVAEKEGSVIKLKVVPKPSSKQKKLLDRLGYNNWRRSLVTPK